MNYLHGLYLLLLIIASGVGIYRYRILDTASKVFCVLIIFIMLSEFTALYSALKYQTNLGVYNISMVLQAALVCCYFNYSIDLFSGKHIGLWIGVFSLLGGFSSLIFHQPEGDLNSWFIVYNGFLSISMGMLAFSRFMLGNNTTRLKNDPHFWFVVIIILSWSSTLLNWTIFNNYNNQLAAYATYATLLIIIVNILTYSAIGTVFLFYPKMINNKQ